jgi:hypothetical protein
MIPSATVGSPRSFRYAPATLANGFTRLFSVTVTHNYYTQDKGLCPDFQMAPTPSSAQLMASLGLLFKYEGAGFSVLVRPDELPNLIAYVRRHAQGQPSEPGFWSRLTFVMTLVNPLFVGITALPIDTKPTQVNLYGCNSQAHLQNGAIVLSEGDFFGGDALFPVVGTNIALIVPPGTRFVTVADISGSVVETVKVKVPPQSGASSSDGLAVSVNLSNLPYDLYTIGIQNGNGKPLKAGGYPRTLLYVPARPTTMCLLDMLFTQPTPESPGIYPLPSLFGSSRPPLPSGDTAYVLPFDARPTYWQYYVVSQTPDGTLGDLRIEGTGTRFRQRKKPVLLPDGSSAVLFEALTTLPLRQKSTQRFQLSGYRRDASGQQSEVRVASLPVAPAVPVWPGPAKKDATGTSEMFVYI